MKKYINRKVAIKLYTSICFLTMPAGELDKELDNAICELDKTTSLLSVYRKNAYLFRFLENRFADYSNDFLSQKISEHFNAEIFVIGKKKKMYKCQCCEYFTLRVVSQYSICPICYWEDDGSNAENPHKYSHPNHMSLADGRENFIKYGVVEKRFAALVESERFLKYKN